MAIPGPHPDPPSGFHALNLPTIRSRPAWIRIHRRDLDPIYFSRDGRSRFDDPEAAFGVLYLAADAYGAFIEVFGRVLALRTVTDAALRARHLARIVTTRPLVLADLVSPGALARIGADGRLTSGDHAVAQRWARAIWRHPRQPDGIYYRLRHDPSRHACALFDRAAEAIAVEPEGSLYALKNQPVVEQALQLYGFSLIEEG